MVIPTKYVFCYFMEIKILNQMFWGIFIYLERSNGDKLDSRPTFKSTCNVILKKFNSTVINENTCKSQIMVF
jgi:hypothetical protein